MNTNSIIPPGYDQEESYFYRRNKELLAQLRAALLQSQQTEPKSGARE